MFGCICLYMFLVLRVGCGSFSFLPFRIFYMLLTEEKSIEIFMADLRKAKIAWALEMRLKLLMSSRE